MATIRAQSYSPIQTLVVQVRGIATNPDEWQTVALDGAGRINFKPTQPGLVDIRVTATDQDGFSTTQTHTVRVKDPLDTSAPLLAWAGVLAGSTGNTAPVSISATTAVQVSLQEQQLMGYRVQMAPANTNNWATLSSTDSAASAMALTELVAATLAPEQFANGVYQLRITAWDLAGRTSEITSRVIIDSANKQAPQAAATDAVYSLGGHDFALMRVLDATVADNTPDAATEPLGNWRIPALQTGLTTDQASTTEQGAVNAWQEGAKVWLTAPQLTAPQSGTADIFIAQNLSFTLSVLAERALPGGSVATVSTAPLIYRPVFNGSPATQALGWSLQAHTEDNSSAHAQGQGYTPEALQRLGTRLYSQSGVQAGLPWVPTSYTLTGPDGTRYALDAQGQLTGVHFVDGVQWLVTQAGIVVVAGTEATTASPTTSTTSAAPARLELTYDSLGRIIRATGPTGSANAAAITSAIAYKYDSQGRLVLSRPLNSADTGTPYGYDSAGLLLQDRITANLGAVVNWTTSAAASQWAGSIGEGGTTTVAFTIRESEIASTVKTPGAVGAVIVAIVSDFTDPEASLQVTGAVVLGSSIVNGKMTTLVRITEAGLKLIRITGTGSAVLRISLAGDINADGKVDGADGALFNAGPADDINDINGNGQVNAADRQILYANYGFKANQAPVQTGNTSLTTHTDLSTQAGLAQVAQDMEGDALFWRILGATHGSASLSVDGQTLLFTPEVGYAGQASITVQADDGFAVGVPIQLVVNVSDAKLIAINIARIPTLATASNGYMSITGDFEDEENVRLTGNYLQYSSSDSNVISVRADGLVKAKTNGRAIVHVSARGIEGVNVFTVSADPAAMQLDENGFEVDVYPRAITLALQAQRQLKVSLPDRTDISAASAGTQYFVSDASIADITPDGLIHAKANGQ